MGFAEIALILMTILIIVYFTVPKLRRIGIVEFNNMDKSIEWDELWRPIENKLLYIFRTHASRQRLNTRDMQIIRLGINQAIMSGAYHVWVKRMQLNNFQHQNKDVFESTVSQLTNDVINSLKLDMSPYEEVVPDFDVDGLVITDAEYVEIKNQIKASIGLLKRIYKH